MDKEMKYPKTMQELEEQYEGIFAQRIEVSFFISLMARTKPVVYATNIKDPYFLIGDTN